MVSTPTVKAAALGVIMRCDMLCVSCNGLGTVLFCGASLTEGWPGAKLVIDTGQRGVIEWFNDKSFDGGQVVERKKATSEAAQTIGLNHQVLINYIRRHPDLKPADRLPNGDYLWSDEEIERLIEARKEKKRRVRN
jgi:hypothetical protein